MKTYDVCVKNKLRIYKFHITAKGVADALKKLDIYISLADREYKLKFIMERTTNNA